MCGYFETLNETLTEHGFLLDFQLPPADATKEDRRPICGLRLAESILNKKRSKNLMVRSMQSLIIIDGVSRIENRAPEGIIWLRSSVG